MANVVSQGTPLLNKYTQTAMETNQVTSETSKLQHIYSSGDESHRGGDGFLCTCVVIEKGKVVESLVFQSVSLTWMYISLLLSRKYMADRSSPECTQPGVYWDSSPEGISVYELKIKQVAGWFTTTMQPTREEVAKISLLRSRNNTSEGDILTRFHLKEAPGDLFEGYVMPQELEFARSQAHHR